ncbi:MAG: GNAT family N-acyltransferase [Terracidiphilus sp.]
MNAHIWRRVPLKLHLSSTSVPKIEGVSGVAELPLRAPVSRVHADVGRYRLRLAETAKDREAACRLRFKVFNIELGEGLESSYYTGLDVDRFDTVCEHLLVEDKLSRRVVGTYRMQSGETAARNLGYYSEQEFCLKPYEPLRAGILELGRASIDREHRTPEVLMLLWRGIAQYATEMGLRYLLGCSSLNSNDPAEGWQMYRQLAQFRVPIEFETAPTTAYACPAELQDVSAQPFACQTDGSNLENATGPENAAGPDGSLVAPAAKVPKLLKTYLAIGARIAAPPAWDREFRTIDFLTLLDLKLLSAAARNRFLAPLTT